MPRRPSWWQLACLGLAPLLLLGPILASGRLFLPQIPSALEPFRSEDPARAERAAEGQNFPQSDRLFPFLTDQLAARAELGAGHAPTWEPLLGLGVPLFAESLAGFAYPPNALALALPPERAAGPLAALTLLLAGLGAYLFLRRLELHAGAALFGAVAYQLGGWGVANLFYFMKVDAALWFPWALWAIEGIARGRRFSGLALCLSLAASILAGMITIGAFVLAGSGLYALLRLRPGAVPDEPVAAGRSLLQNPLVVAASFALLGLGASAVWVLPMIEASRESMRQEASPEVLLSQSLPVATSLGFVLPDLFGTPVEATPSGALPAAWWLTPPASSAAAEQANQLEWNTYAGLVVCALALVGVLANTRRARVPLAFLLAVVGFAQGWPILRLAYALPGLNAGHPARVLALAWFLWPWLAALGVQALIEKRARSWVVLCTAAGAALLCGVYLWSTGDGERFAAELEETLIERYDELSETSHVRARLPLEASIACGERLVSAYGRMALTAGALLAAGLLLRVSRRSTAVLPALTLTLLVVVEGRLAASGHLSGRPDEGELFPPSEAIDAVRAAAGEGRVLRFDPSPEGLTDVHALARPNMLQPYGMADVTPWIVFVPRTYNELFACFDPHSRVRQGVARISDAGFVDHPILDRMDVRAILSRHPLEHRMLEPMLERPGFCVYRRGAASDALGPARLVPSAMVATSDEAGLVALATRLVDPSTHVLVAPEFAAQANEHGPSAESPGRIASFERPAKNRLRIRVEDSMGGWLVVHQQFYPGWRAQVNGEPAALLRADHALQALRVEAGDSVVELAYAPGSLRLGLLLSCACLGLALLLNWRGLDRVGHARPDPGQR